MSYIARALRCYPSSGVSPIEAAPMLVYPTLWPTHLIVVPTRHPCAGRDYLDTLICSLVPSPTSWLKESGSPGGSVGPTRPQCLPTVLIGVFSLEPFFGFDADPE